MKGVIMDSMRLEGGAGMLGLPGDPQPAFDWVEEGEVCPKGEGRLEEREDIVGIVDRSRDMFNSCGLVMRMGKERQRGEVFYMMRERTWHVSNPTQGPRSLLQWSTLSIRSGKSRKLEIRGVR